LNNRLKGGINIEQQTMLKEILHTLNVHSEKIDKRFDQVDISMNEMDTKINKMNTRIDKMSTRIDNLESKMDKRFDRLEKRLDGMRVELTPTQSAKQHNTRRNTTNLTNSTNTSSQLKMLIGIEIINYPQQLSLNNARFYTSFKALRL